MKLNVGAGDVPIEGYTPIDRKLGSEAYPLNVPDDKAEEIRASHVLEHFDWKTVPKVLADWYRVLQPGGIIKVAVPNMKWIAEHANHRLAPYYMMGGQTDENDYHKSAYTPETLQALLERAGFTDVKPWKSDAEDCASLPVSLNLMGRKPLEDEDSPNAPRTKIAAVMSMPRLAFSDNMFAAVAVFGPLGIPLSINTGAFWGQCLERSMVKHLDDGTEWLLCLDYDTVFDIDTIQKLCQLMADYPEADAIAPVQVRREEDYSLVTIEDESGKRRQTLSVNELQEPLLKAASAHFGLTLFRVSALKKMEHPWFLGIPNKDGEWGEGRTDDDIYFWRKWKQTGNSLFIAPHIGIGHLQLMITWPDERFRPIHQYRADYQKHGAPKVGSPLQAPAQSSNGAPEFRGNGKAVRV